ncbi:MAG: ankyrin repeat domain-containing protein [Rhodocyclaceae bacterium]|nr:ankyrin repeat domain-containing protein [Rhodocyclaceae bacterium]
MNTKPGQKFFNHCSTGRAIEVAALLQAGVDPEARDSNHLTGLIWAGRKGHIDVARVFLQFGANINNKDKRGRTSLSHAVAYKRHDFVQFMLESGAEPNPIDIHSWTPLDIANSNRDERMMEVLKSHGGRSGMT